MDRFPDIHPDDLLDRERSGDLSADDRARLARHVAVCPACALERVAPDDFAKEIHGLSSNDPVADAVAEAVVRRLETARAGGAGRAVKGRPVGWIRWTAALAAVLATAVAAAFVVPAVRDRAARAAFVSVERAVRPVTIVAVDVAFPDMPLLESADPALEQPLDGSAAPKVPAPGASASAQAEAGGGPEALFARANQARRQRRDAEAIALYRDLQRRFPASREARLSRATLGQLLLDKGDAAGARDQYDRYLADDRGGTVGEEALAGRALALGRMGKVAEERAAWQALLAAYPGSVHAARARKRLSELR